MTRAITKTANFVSRAMSNIVISWEKAGLEKAERLMELYKYTDPRTK